MAGPGEFTQRAFLNGKMDLAQAEAVAELIRAKTDKTQAAALAESGYAAPLQRMAVPAPGTAALAALETGIFLMGEAGFASEHDQKVARWAAYILCGGRVTAGSAASEQYLLDLEREAFLSLCGERKTQERIAFTLKTGKPLRN